MPLTQVSTGMIADSAVTQAKMSSDLQMATYGMKNRIINGDMRIDQRNAGAEINPAVSSTYYLDRWRASSTQAGKFKIGQNAGAVTPPAGFVNYLGCTSLSAYTPATTEECSIEQFVEANNVSDLGWGAAGGSSVTLSFWVRSSLTGTFGGLVGNSGNNRSYVYSYTINSANTWEYKTVTIPADITGTWGLNGGNVRGMRVSFSLGCGPSVTTAAGSWQAGYYANPTGGQSVVGTNGATFYITGVQLEKGSTATSFDYRPYGTELALCQRYYWQGKGTMAGSTYLYGAAGASYVVGELVSFSSVMRAQPTVAAVGTPTYTNCTLWDIAPNANGFTVRVNVTSSGTYRINQADYSATSEL